MRRIMDSKFVLAADQRLLQDGTGSVQVEDQSVGRRVELSVTNQILESSRRGVTVARVESVGSLATTFYERRTVARIDRNHLDVDLIKPIVRYLLTVPDGHLPPHKVGDVHVLAQHPVGAVVDGNVTAANDVVKRKVSNPTLLVAAPDEIAHVVTHGEQSAGSGEHVSPHDKVVGLATKLELVHLGARLEVVHTPVDALMALHDDGLDARVMRKSLHLRDKLLTIVDDAALAGTDLDAFRHRDLLRRSVTAVEDDAVVRAGADENAAGNLLQGGGGEGAGHNGLHGAQKPAPGGQLAAGVLDDAVAVYLAHLGGRVLHEGADEGQPGLGEVRLLDRDRAHGGEDAVDGGLDGGGVNVVPVGQLGEEQGTVLVCGTDVVGGLSFPGRLRACSATTRNVGAHPHNVQRVVEGCVQELHHLQHASPRCAHRELLASHFLALGERDAAEVQNGGGRGAVPQDDVGGRGGQVGAVGHEAQEELLADHVGGGVSQVQGGGAAPRPEPGEDGDELDDGHRDGRLAQEHGLEVTDELGHHAVPREVLAPVVDDLRLEVGVELVEVARAHAALQPRRHEALDKLKQPLELAALVALDGVLEEEGHLHDQRGEGQELFGDRLDVAACGRVEEAEDCAEGLGGRLALRGEGLEGVDGGVEGLQLRPGVEGHVIQVAVLVSDVEVDDVQGHLDHGQQAVVEGGDELLRRLEGVVGRDSRRSHLVVDPPTRQTVAAQETPGQRAHVPLRQPLDHVDVRLRRVDVRLRRVDVRLRRAPNGLPHVVDRHRQLFDDLWQL
ncbi:A disintegrin and metallo ase with thrombospondin motifs 18, putative [Babesia caballi]|uniref:A disintegrin and metallo ase with thrombospondin motifs 18, putative n=1 Tax=Babesia caballi TaxID=5871 RepID=A0AAV4LQQ5_BABCB|nr:A disintegrin and metallo ase with thrombospondin motifs 18, putative [Babesia caballi]